MVRGDPVCRKEDFSQYDIGLFFKEISSYSNQHKLKFIENVLAYSKYLDGAFCLPRVLFGVQCGRNSNKLEKLYKSPLTLWTSAISRFTKHAIGNVRCIILQWLQWRIFWKIWQENRSQLVNRSTTYFNSKSKEIAKFWNPFSEQYFSAEKTT